MTETIAGLDYARLEFDKKGQRTNAGELIAPGTTDLVVISHGWHQDAPSSHEMYAKLIGNLVGLPNITTGRKIGVIGVFWPSDKFRDDLGFETQIGGGAATAAGGNAGDAFLREQAREIARFLDADDVEAFAKIAMRAKGGGADADDLLDELRRLSSDTPDEQTRLDHAELLTRKGREIIKDLSLSANPVAPEAALGAGGAAAGSVLSGLSKGVAKALNQFAYFELKKRAGVIGEKLGLLLNGSGVDGVRLHLIGHSFGARLVTSAARKLAKPAQSMCLLQAAFSHNSFSEKVHYDLNGAIRGGFRDIITEGKVKGPIAITHTWRDKAVGLAYPAASRVGQQVASDVVKTTDTFGGPKDAYGGLGANGAVGMGSDAISLVYDGHAAIAFVSGKVTNVKCDAITSHGDISRIEVARIIAAALTA